MDLRVTEQAGEEGDWLFHGKLEGTRTKVIIIKGLNKGEFYFC